MQDQFDALGVRVVGVGDATPEVTAAFAADHSVRYELWSDTEHVLAAHYDVLTEWDDGPLRHAWILNEEGDAVLFHAGAVSLGADPYRVLEDCRTLFSNSN
ncbi:MAG: redoxin domain-containing protein [Alphaproteobacteria bacterium]|nr:redoxin domain-containing protein [Alphaproteobacteria bacterium]